MRLTKNSPVWALAATLAPMVVFLSCGGGGGQGGSVAPTGSFSLQASSGSIHLNPGTSAQFQISRLSIDGFDRDVNVAFTGLPAGVTLSPATFTLKDGSPATVTATAASDVVEADGSLKCEGTSGALTATQTIPITVGIGSFTLQSSVSSIELVPGGSQQFQVQRVARDGFNRSVSVSFTGLPQGVTIAPATVTLAGGESATLTMSASAYAPEASAPVTCTGTCRSLTATTTIQTSITFNNASFTPAALDLPVMNINTNGVPIVSKEDYVTGHMSLDPGGSAAYEGDLQIRGRGNSTWGMPKKPYKVKLNAKAPLFGFPTSKDWALLANYSDKTLLRNVTAMELSRRLGLAYSPRTASTEVFLNGQYMGAYLLIESIKIASSRVNIPSLTATDTTGTALTGGYLLEVDTRNGEPVHWPTTRQVPMNLHEPDPPTAEQLAYITNYVQQAEDSLYAPDFADPVTGYAKYLDVDSFINWYLLNEVFSNVDSYFYSSCWMYKDRGGKLFMGPAWDFDLGAGNVDYCNARYPHGWWTRTGPWYTQLFKDPAFAAKVKDRWNAVKATQLDTIYAYIDQKAAQLDQAQQNNFHRWPILGVYVWPNPVIPGSYAGEVEQLKTWLNQRIAWMDSQLNQ